MIVETVILRQITKMLEFQIKFITPLLIHGAESREVDTIGLTGKALRGCWRFWFRAIVGGLLDGSVNGQDLLIIKLLNLESRIFGSASERQETIGARFRMVIEPPAHLELKIKKDIHPGFQKGFNFTGFEFNDDDWFKVKILPRSIMTDKGGARPQSYQRKEVKILPRSIMTDKEQEEVLLAIIWLWANLGAVGQRARRGFGSPVISGVNNAEDPFKSIGLSGTPDFNDNNSLKQYLQTGVKKVAEQISGWLIENGEQPKSDIENNRAPTEASFFILKSIRQIAVSEETFDQNAISVVHGSKRCDSLGWVESGNRMASPVFTRLHKVGNNFASVITFCKQRVNSIVIPDDSCLRAYLQGGNCNHEVNFPGLGITKNLKGERI